MELKIGLNDSIIGEIINQTTTRLHGMPQIFLSKPNWKILACEKCNFAGCCGVLDSVIDPTEENLQALKALLYGNKDRIITNWEIRNALVNCANQQDFNLRPIAKKMFYSILRCNETRVNFTDFNQVMTSILSFHMITNELKEDAIEFARAISLRKDYRDDGIEYMIDMIQLLAGFKLYDVAIENILEYKNDLMMYESRRQGLFLKLRMCQAIPIFEYMFNNYEKFDIRPSDVASYLKIF
jgi:hypothetical protein